MSLHHILKLAILIYSYKLFLSSFLHEICVISFVCNSHELLLMFGS
jgi:hypothetical protein